MGFLDSLKDSFNNSADISNPFESNNQGSSLDKLGSAFGNLMGDVVDTVKSAAGAITPQFASKEDAEDSLFNDKPKWLDPKQAESIGLDEKTSKVYPDMTQIRNFVRVELLRRSNNFGNTYPNNGEFAGPMNDSSSSLDVASLKYEDPSGTWKPEMFLSDEYVGQVYKGPKAAWTRVISNSIVKKDEKDSGFQGFIMHGVDNFDEMYGFSNSNGAAPGDCVLGYDCSGNMKSGHTPKAHILQERDFKHRPPPGITGIDSEEMGVGKNQKKTTIKFTAWSRSQVDYLDPYFFTPGNTLIIEWGWNTFDREILIDPMDVGSAPLTAKGKDLSNSDIRSLNDIRASDPDYALDPITNFDAETEYEYFSGSGLIGLWNSSKLSRKKLREGNGNYSFCTGMVSNYSYSIRDDGGYDCTVEIISMAYFLQTLNTKASNTTPSSDKPADPVDNRALNLNAFVSTHLSEMITTGDGDPDEWWDGNSDLWEASPGADKIWDDSQNLLKARGRYFSFGLTSGDMGTTDQKQYMAGSPSQGTYLTMGYIVDIFNAFYAKKSETTGATMFQFNIEGQRCTAHPNIKSTDGNVLLIPNSMAPRHNLLNYKSTTIGLAGEGAGIYASDDSINSSVSYDKLSNPKNDDANRSAFIAAIAASTGNTGIKTLEQAMNESPRDDLHRLMTLHPEIDGEGNTSVNKVSPFPDYKIIDNTIHTEGMSGRIQDLFVNFEILKDAVKNGTTASDMLKTILKKISNAAGGIWDFDLVGADPGDNSSSVLTIKDMTSFTNTVDDMSRSDQTYVFKAHQKNSIVRSMSCDISIPGDVASMTLYGGNSGDPSSEFFSDKPGDRLLKKAKPISKSATDAAVQAKKLQGNTDIPSEEKFLMGISVYQGATNFSGKKIDIYNEIAANSGVPGATKSGNTSVSDGWGSNEGRVIDIEFVDPDKDRMLSMMQQDKNPKNCVKYNMPIAGIELSLQLDGIEGIRLWDMFNCTGVPTRYYMKGLWRVTGVKQSISGNDWTTDISAQFAPNSTDSVNTNG